MTDIHEGTNRQGQGNSPPDLVAADNARCQEDVLVELKPKAFVYWAALLMYLVVWVFFIFGAIIPVLKTGSYASVWPSTDKRIGVKVGMFYMGWIWVLLFPYSISIINYGRILFYIDRLEVKSFITNRKMVFYYEESIVDCSGNYRMVMYNKDVPSWRDPFGRYKIKYLDAVSFSLLPTGYKDPSGIKHAVELLREKVFAFNDKSVFM